MNLSPTSPSRRLICWAPAVVLLLLTVLLSACQSAATLPTATVPATSAPEPTDPATATALPATATPTTAPTATATPTELPPTATAIPALAMNTDGLQILCLPNTYPLAARSAEIFTSGAVAVKQASINPDSVQVSLPVNGCGVFVSFNQPLENEANVEIYEGADPTPWYSRPLAPVEGQTNLYYAILDHEYLNNPPVWDLSFGLKIRSVDQVFWEGRLDLERPFNGLCWEGSVPDPLTLKCPKVDKMEREPHPDMPTFVPDGLK